MDKNSLDEMARYFGRLYDESLQAAKLCEVKDCEHRNKGGTCLCTDEVKDVVDMIWEVKEGHVEGFDAFVDKAMIAADARDESMEA